MKYKKYIIACLLLLVIGFALVSTILNINGTTGVSTYEDDFDIIFTDARASQNNLTSSKVITDATAVIESDEKNITFTTQDLAVVGEWAQVDFEITNYSIYYDAEVKVQVDLVDPTQQSLVDEYLEITTKENWDDDDTIEAGTRDTGWVKVSIKKAYLGDSTTAAPKEIKFKVSYVTNAKERDTKANVIHTPSKDIEYDLDETTGKYTAKVVCTRCEEVLEKETVDSTINVVNATCTTDGTKTYEAQFTNPKFTKQTKVVILPKLGHNPVDAHNGTAATCTTSGVLSDTVCTRCGEVLSKGTIIPALGHNYVDRLCTRCNHGIELVVPSYPATTSSERLYFTTTYGVTYVNDRSTEVFRSVAFDVTEFKSISITGYATNIGSNGAHGYIYLYVPATGETSPWAGRFELTSSTITMDVSNYKGTAYVIVLGNHSANNASSITVTHVGYTLKAPNA